MHGSHEITKEKENTSTYLLNMLPSQTLNHKIPLQILATQTNIPPVQMLPPRVFGCSVFVHIPKTNRTKFDPCAEKCVFVGYATHQKEYRFTIQSLTVYM